MGFTSQPPLSSLGAQGGFVPGAPPPTIAASWSPGAQRASEATSPSVSLYGFVSPTVVPSSAVDDGSIQPAMTMFNPSNISVGLVSTPALDQSVQPGYGAVPVYASGTFVSPLVSSNIVAPMMMAPSIPTVAPQQRMKETHTVPTFSPSAASATSLRGRERYCSGGAWVGPAPGWPKPPAAATIENADTSRVPPNRRPIVDILTEKYKQAIQNAPAMRLKELEGISNKIGGMFVFLNNSGASLAGSDDPNAITAPVLETLSALVCDLSSGNASSVNAILLYLSQNHWDEVSYWYPALKRLVKM